MDQEGTPRLIQLNERRKYTSDKIKDLQGHLSKSKGLLGNKACVYATGSFGRLEAGTESDLDLFIVGRPDDSDFTNGTVDERKIRKSQLARLDEILVKADLISATRRMNFPPFDGDGKYLIHYSLDELTKTLGKPEDDFNNTLTGRLLLFLESQPLLGEEVYQSIIDDVIVSYWGEFSEHESNFLPAFLVNDILRLWRTFCVNYEARTKRAPEDKKAKRKVKNYKLKHSRMLTCYSALLYFLAVYGTHGTVSPTDAMDMTKLTPTERLEWLAKHPDFTDANKEVRSLLLQYERFLENTSCGDEALQNIFLSDRKKSSELMAESYDFGDLIYKALLAVGKDSRLLRLITV